MKKETHGFFVLPHELTKLSMWQDEFSLKLMLYCIDNAAHKPHMFDGKRIEVGQFPTSYRKMEQELGWGHQTLRTHLTKLQHKYHEIEVRSGTHGTLIIVLKYKQYQKGSASVLTDSTLAENGCAVNQHASVLNDDTQVCCQTALQNNSTEQVQNNISLASLEQQYSSLWDVYPKKLNRRAGLKEYARQIRAGATHEAIMKALDAERTSPNWVQDNGRFIPAPAKWLSDEKWREYITQEPTEEKPTWSDSF